MALAVKAVISLLSSPTFRDSTTSTNTSPCLDVEREAKPALRPRAAQPELDYSSPLAVSTDSSAQETTLSVSEPAPRSTWQPSWST